MGTRISLILASVILLALLGAGCVGEGTPGQGSVPSIVSEDGQVLQVFGDVTGQGIILQGVPRGTIDTVTFTVGLAPGTKTVDMGNLSIVYTDAVRTETLTPVSGLIGNPPPGAWGILMVKNQAGNPNTRLDFEEQLVIRVNPKAPIVPNQVITISIKPVEGKPLIIRRVAPATIQEDENVLAPI
jgi:archaellin